MPWRQSCATYFFNSESETEGSTPSNSYSCRVSETNAQTHAYLCLSVVSAPYTRIRTSPWLWNSVVRLIAFFAGKIHAAWSCSTFLRRTMRAQRLAAFIASFAFHRFPARPHRLRPRSTHVLTGADVIIARTPRCAWATLRLIVSVHGSRLLGCWARLGGG